MDISPKPSKNTIIPLSFENNKYQLTYKECLKNHAASIGGHALDGCGEFMPSTDPNSLKCAVCDCHRNFHRQESHDHYSKAPHFLPFHHHYPPQRFLKLSPAAPEENKHHVVVTPVTPTAENVSSRKRFRTKFSQEQKEKMQIFSQNLGWKLHKSDELMGEEFCKEIGVDKSVLKVWMHNNKTTLGKRENSNSTEK